MTLMRLQLIAAIALFCWLLGGSLWMLAMDVWPTTVKELTDGR